MLAAQRVGDALQLQAGARVGPHLDRPGPKARPGLEPAVLPQVLGQAGAGQRHPLGQRPGGGQQDGAGPAGHRQGQHLGALAVAAGEPVAEVQQAAHVRAAEGVDRLVRVADDDEVAAGPGDGLQQPLLGRIGVLVLVDDHEVVPGAQQGPPVGRLGVDHGPLHQLAVVERPLRVEHLEVLREEPRGGHPVGALGLGEGAQGLRLQPEPAGPRNERADLVGETPGGQRDPQVGRPADGALGDLPGQQLADHQLLLRPGQQAQRTPDVLRRPGLPGQRVGEGVEGPGALRGDGAAQPGPDPLPQLGRGLAAEGQREHPVRVGARLDASHDRLDHRGRLAGARAGQHQQRPVPGTPDPLDHGLLRRVERGGPDGGQRTAQQPVRGVVARRRAATCRRRAR